MDDIYREHILDHYRNPRNFGPPSPLRLSSGLRKGERIVSVKETNASCGDVIEIYLIFKGKKTVDVRFTGVGCAISMAASSLLTERIKNGQWTMDNLKKWTEKDMEELLGISLSPGRIKCAMLPLVAVRKAL